MNHNDIRHKLSEYIDGAVSSDERAAIAEHLKTCENCNDALKELRKTIEHIKTVEEVEPPAWMAQKIMAKVRAGAPHQKSFSERLYSVFFANLPVRAVAVLFLTLTAYFVYQNIIPADRYAEAPRVAMAKKESPGKDKGASGAREEALDNMQGSTQRSKQVPQSPESKALDMKQAYEKPALPALADKIAPVPAPAKFSEQPVFAKKETTPETRAVVPQAGASAAAEQGADAAPQANAKLKSGAPARHALKAEAASKTGPAIILQAKGIEVAAEEVEHVIARLGGSILRRENPGTKKVYAVLINVEKLQDLKAKLRLIGEIEDKAEAPVPQEGMVELRIELEVKPDQQR